MGYFMVAVSDEYHATAIDAVRFFDENHMIFSENVNWEGIGEQYSKHILLSIARAEGYYHKGPNDVIAAITGQFYSLIPEEIPDDDRYHSYFDEFDEYKILVEHIYDNTDPHCIMPLLNGEFTIHADWEYEMDYNITVEPTDPAKCPVISESYGGVKVCFAPFPHGIEDGINDCNNPRNYSYTETGLGDHWVNPENGVYHLGRGDDYDIATSILLDPVPLGGTNYNLVLGNIYHGLYDHQYAKGKKKGGEDQRTSTHNWGILSPLLKTYNDPEDEQQPYAEMTEAIRVRNGAFEENISGNAWDGSDPGTYQVIPVKADCYEGGGDCPAVYDQDTGLLSCSDYYPDPE